MSNVSKDNKIAWEFNSYEFWHQYNGKPYDLAQKLVKNPKYALRRHIELFGEIKNKKIANPLGSNGRKAVPLALLGAEITIIDISEGNMRYAIELAEAANVSIRYELCDLLEFDITKTNNYNYDILYLEGGILHYFEDITVLMNKLHKMLNKNGIIILNDFHPFRKLIQISNGNIELHGNYFDSEIKEAEVAYARIFKGIDAEEFPKCRLRYYTMGEIITSMAETGFRIKKVIEEERYDEFKGIPGNLTILGIKD